ncbi:xanthine dehydrogenase family protein molybdopterin-binding subunit [Spongiactinospora sp. TRM90649]|uniref:xanthine dehydrogenase family protein molybdopterin-binding subunit n=1 Tax=Spongiactinospora sp. TRM90649 TaxID=3031114 RepID=UPI0023F84235|nr:xanthine dehydrogenase family protein molybdopterin-binding subunit [Spongiactinospora sp. TRM90649]MDF5752062.1 xanthine dehydrogenase family protein molybdopterin-binding subunit [Spongiactinospora sp. TRM90649]
MTTETTTGAFGTGLKDREGPAMVRGATKFTSDLTLPGMLHLEFVRSEHGHARIDAIDTARAAEMPGVVDIVTGADLAGKLMPLPCIWIPGGVESHFPPHPYGLPGAGTVLAEDRVRFIGEPVAAVVAETAVQAREAALRVRVDYTPLPAVTRPEQALAEGAPQLHDAVPGNLNARWTCGDADATDAAIAAAEVVVELDLYNQRTINNPMEPRAALGAYDPITDDYTLYATTQSPHNHRFLLSALVLGIPFNKLRVIAPPIGGSFGTKGYLYPDMPLVLFLAKRLGRPVKWTDTREGLMRSTVQGRDHTQHVTIAGTRDGRITALRCTSHANLGAYPSTIGPGVATALMGRSITGPYAIPSAFCEVYAVFTNTVPLGAQRGSGRAEATTITERAMDLFAAEIGVDPAEVRLRNMVPPDRFPYDNGLGWTYDSGDYPAALRRALEMAGYPKAEVLRREARDRGKLLGVGIGSFVAVCGVGPSTRMRDEGMLGGTWEGANIRVQPNGEVALCIGSTSTGQSHRTTFAQIVADELGIDVETVVVFQSDTQRAPYGQGTYGSRSYSVAGPAIALAARQIIAKMKTAAAHFMGVPEDSVVYEAGTFSVPGDKDAVKSFQDIAMAVWYGWALPAGMEPALDATTFFDPPDFNYPFGSHVAVVEIDEETGKVDVVRYVAVNDVGPIGNPLVVTGQFEGSIVHGLGQALMEEARYDEDGRLLTADLLGYAMPRAADVPNFDLDNTVTPTPHNPLGVKGAGEIATVPVTAAVANAVCDALRDYGVRHVDMPFTAEKIWRVIRDAKG